MLKRSKDRSCQVAHSDRSQRGDATRPRDHLVEETTSFGADTVTRREHDDGSNSSSPGSGSPQRARQVVRG